MSTELKVGVVVLIAIGVFAFFIIRIQETGMFKAGEGYQVRAQFNSIAGLADDAPVRLAGVQVGNVVRIELTDDGRAEVTMVLDPKIQLHQDAAASVASLGLLGEKYLQVTAGSLQAPIVPRGGLIQGGTPVSLDQMVAVLNGIAGDVQQTTQSLSNVFGTEAGQTRMERILQNLEDFSADLGSLVDTNQQAVGATLDNVQSMTGGLKDSLPPLVAQLQSLVQELSNFVESNESPIAKSAANLEGFTDSLGRSSAELEEIMSKVNRGDGTISRLINEPNTINKANAALDRIDDSLNSFDTFFNRVGQTQFTFSLRSEFYEETDDAKNYFGVRMGLGPGGNRGFIFQAVDDNVGTFDVTKITTEKFGSRGELLDRQLERRSVLDEGFLFSALLAQRSGHWQLRGGLLESEAGGGVDYFAGRNDLWRLTFEAWDFGRDDNPHLKLRGQYRVFDRLFVTGGWDDLASDAHRQFFIGGGYSFRR
ncbi:MAG: MlaD family protein [Acidobacteriota bacterium]